MTANKPTMHIAVLNAGERLVKELELISFNRNITIAGIKLLKGEIALLVSPKTLIVDTIDTVVRVYPTKLYTDYIINGKVLFNTSERLDGDEWVPDSAPAIYLPFDSKLYVSNIVSPA